MKDYWKEPQIINWCQYLLDSYLGQVKKELIIREGSPLEQAECLFNSPFVVASHGTQPDPILNYGNRAALDLWQMSWVEFVQTPSRQTAEPMNREERSIMLEQARAKGYIANYRGVRISKTGKRFFINNATIWNILTPDSTLLGQGATFSEWDDL